MIDQHAYDEAPYLCHQSTVLMGWWLFMHAVWYRRLVLHVTWIIWWPLHTAVYLLIIVVALLLTLLDLFRGKS